MNFPKHILVFRFSAMGDVAMAVPVIRALISKYTELKITIVTRGFFTPFFRDMPNVEVFSIDTKGEHKGLLGLYKLSNELKKLKFDAIADIHNVLRTKILKLFLSERVVQIDKGRTEKNALISGRQFEQLKSTHQRYIDVFDQLGYPVEVSQPMFPEKIILNAKLKNFISNSELSLIGLAPFAAHKGKMYPLDKMRKVITALSQHYSIILFGGGHNETEILNSIENEFDNVTSVAGRLSLDEELDIISNLDVMISMDSGNGHIAAMLGVKVITIWGVTHPFAGFTPFNQPEKHQLTADRNQYPKIPTSIYGNTFPKGYEIAAGSVSVKQIVDKVESVLAS